MTVTFMNVIGEEFGLSKSSLNGSREKERKYRKLCPDKVVPLFTANFIGY